MPKQHSRQRAAHREGFAQQRDFLQQGCILRMLARQVLPQLAHLHMAEVNALPIPPIYPLLIQQRGSAGQLQNAHCHEPGQPE